MQKQQELLERLREESAAKDRLALELHTAKGECDRHGGARLRRPIPQPCSAWEQI